VAQTARPSNPIARHLPAVNWAAGYVGIPFADVGFDRSGLNCWGLVCLVFSEQLGIDLPRHDTLTAAQLAGAAREIRRNAEGGGPWRKVEQPIDFDVVLMLVDDPKGRAMPSHVGLAVGPGRILHAERGHGTVCVSTRHVSVRERILGVWRHDAALRTD
jgi:cell wall-associated NlpC family hydrolase